MGGMKASPQIIELVGPAGAGKSTLAHTLEQRSGNIALVSHPCWRDPGQLLFFAREGLALLPTFVQCAYRPNGQWLRPDEMAWMAILHGWHHLLRRQVVLGGGVFLIDTGAITILASIHASGPGVLTGSSTDEWWHTLYRQWAATLDMIIWLDAPNTTLVPRIRGRDQPHELKGDIRCDSLRVPGCLPGYLQANLLGLDRGTERSRNSPLRYCADMPR